MPPQTGSLAGNVTGDALGPRSPINAAPGEATRARGTKPLGESRKNYRSAMAFRCDAPRRCAPVPAVRSRLRERTPSLRADHHGTNVMFFHDLHRVAALIMPNDAERALQGRRLESGQLRASGSTMQPQPDQPVERSHLANRQCREYNSPAPRRQGAHVWFHA